MLPWASVFTLMDLNFLISKIRRINKILVLVIFENIFFYFRRILDSVDISLPDVTSNARFSFKYQAFGSRTKVVTVKMVSIVQKEFPRQYLVYGVFLER